MWGAIIGDFAGSTYEFEQTKKTHTITPSKLIPEKSFYSDDTILTMAILEAVLKDQNYEYYLKKYANEFKNYKPNFTPYFKTSFSPSFIKWTNSTTQGTSTGNGAMMRISPIGFLFDTEKDVTKNAYLATIPSHNTEEAIQNATTIALIIYLARKHYPKEEIIRKLKLDYSWRPFQKFNTTCSQTIDNCLYALFTTNNFEESIKKTISFGGDTDTNACIVGSIAEALYGIEQQHIEQIKPQLPKQFVKTLNQGYSKIVKL